MKFSCALFLLVLSLSTYAQHEADLYFEKGNYEEAQQLYAQLDKASRTDKQTYQWAVAILNSNTLDKSLAIDLLHQYITKFPNDGNAHYLLGRALAYNKNFEAAEKEFNVCLLSNEISPENKIDAGHQVDMCQNAKALIGFNVDVLMEDLGHAINSSGRDFFPFTDSNEKIIYFNSSRNDGSDEKPNGEYYSNIYFAKVKDGSFEKANPVMGSLNTPDQDEEIVGLSRDGKKAIISFEDKTGNIDLKIAKLENGKFMGFEKLPKGLNTIHHEIAATFGATSDEIYFASDRPGGYGGIDLYVLRKNPNGKWAEPQNLGPEINTVFDEDFPNLSNDNRFLFFSSKGHSSIGGYDIFKATWDESLLRFIKPINVGYPVNTLFDDMNLNFSETGRYGYMSRLSEKGNYNIYRVTFNEIEPEITVCTGQLKLNVNEGELLSGMLMVVEDNSTGEIVGEYLPSPVQLKYVMALKPGSYKLTITIDGYKPLEENIVILSKGSYQPEITKDYILIKE